MAKTNQVQIDDLAPMLDDRDGYEAEYEEQQRVLAWIALNDNIEKAYEQAKAMDEAGFRGFEPKKFDTKVLIALAYQIRAQAQSFNANYI